MEELIYLISPNGQISFTLAEIKSSPFVKGTLLAKTFINDNPAYENKRALHLMWKIEIVMKIIPMIRQGIIYNIKDIEERNELIELLRYVGRDNETWNRRLLCLIYETMDHFGYELTDRKIFDDDIVPYEKLKSNVLQVELMEYIIPLVKSDATIRTNVEHFKPNCATIKIKENAAYGQYNTKIVEKIKYVYYKSDGKHIIKD